MKVGILTMHRVLNYGSALQAYALLHVVGEMGCEVELIDYYFPNIENRSCTLKAKLITLLRDLITGKYVKYKRFTQFYAKYYRCSALRFFNKQSLFDVDMDYDILMTGSDQVWNPIHVKDDYSFFLPFARGNVVKTSYAASFAISELPDDLKHKYSVLLNSYSHISVREKSGSKIIRDLLNRDVCVTCDPTLLLTGKDWSAMISKLARPMKKPYILAYILRYSYDPYPKIYDMIKFLQRKFGYHVVLLDGSMKDSLRRDITVVKTAGPLEFLNWMRHASFVLTTSFHGSAFAINFKIPFLSVVRDKDYSDRRMNDLLENCGLENNIVTYDQELADFDFDNIMQCSYSKVEEFRKNSIEYLKSVVS